MHKKRLLRPTCAQKLKGNATCINSNHCIQDTKIQRYLAYMNSNPDLNEIFDIFLDMALTDDASHYYLKKIILKIQNRDQGNENLKIT